MPEIVNQDGRLVMRDPDKPDVWICAEPIDPREGDQVSVCGYPLRVEPQCPMCHPDPVVEAVARALFSSRVWFEFAPTSPVRGAPDEARKLAAWTAVQTLRGLHTAGAGLDPSTVDPAQLLRLLTGQAWNITGGGKNGSYQRVARRHLPAATEIVVPLDTSAPEHNELMTAALTRLAELAVAGLAAAEILARLATHTR